MNEPNEINIPIKTGGDPKPIAAVTKELDSLKKSIQGVTEAEKEQYKVLQKAYEAKEKQLVIAKATGKSTDDLKRQLASLDAALSTDKAVTVAASIEDENLAASKAKAAQAASAAAEEQKAAALKVAQSLDGAKEKTLGFTGALSALYGGLRKVAYVIPGLGIAGLIGGIVAGVAWLAKMVIGVESATESLKEMSEYTKATEDAFAEGRDKAGDFQVAMAGIQAAQKDSAKILDDYLKKLGEYFDSLTKIADKEKELALAKAELIADPAERAARIAEIKGGAAGTKENLNSQRAAAEQAARDTELMNRYRSDQDRAAELDQQLPGRWKSAADANADFNRQKLTVEAAKKEAAELRLKAGGLDIYGDAGAKAYQAEQRAAKLEKDLENTAKARKFRMAELSAAEEERKKVEQNLKNYDPAAVSSAFNRQVSPMASNRNVESTVGPQRNLYRKLAGMDEQIETAKSIKEKEQKIAQLEERLRNEEGKPGRKQDDRKIDDLVKELYATNKALKLLTETLQRDRTSNNVRGNGSLP